MKRIIALILTLALLLSTIAFMACDRNMGKFYVTFDTQDGSPTTTQGQWVPLDKSGLVYEPEEPQRENYIFKGWYKEPTCENEWDFASDKLKSDDRITLYARFIPIDNTSPNTSTFYRLKEAYNLGILTFDDLYDASFYHNGDYSENNAPSRPIPPRNPEFLNAKTENKIKQTFLDDYYAIFDAYVPDVEFTFSDITISNYCGTYNGAVVVYLEFDSHRHLDVEWSETIAGVTFYYHNENYLRVWVEESVKPNTLDGVSITTQQESYAETVSEITVTWSNKTDLTLDCGYYFHIEKKINGKWYKLFTDKEVSFYSAIFFVYPDTSESEATFTYWISNYTDRLFAGDYRIATYFSALNKDYWVYAEFIVVALIPL